MEKTSIKKGVLVICLIAAALLPACSGGRKAGETDAPSQSVAALPPVQAPTAQPPTESAAAPPVPSHPAAPPASAAPPVPSQAVPPSTAPATAAPAPSHPAAPSASAVPSSPPSPGASGNSPAPSASAGGDSAASAEGYTKYSADYVDLFDTYTTFIAFTKSKEEFDRISGVVYARMSELDKLYDIYNNYGGVNNLKTVNDNAGAAPVAVSRDIIDLVKRGILTYQVTEGSVNIALGPVIALWHDARVQTDGGGPAYIPPMDDLRAAALNTDINNVIVDEDKGTVFLKNKGMALDVGAIAKGFATNLVIEDAKKAGLVSGILNAGGNVVSVGKPMDGRQRWGVGIEDPASVFAGGNDTIDVIYQDDGAVITSGSYERYFTVNGKNYNHIIDPETLQPADRFSSVTILLPDSGLADMLSTALFILPRDRGEAILKRWGAEAMWVTPDEKMYATDGYKRISKTFSDYSASDK